MNSEPSSSSESPSSVGSSERHSQEVSEDDQLRHAMAPIMEASMVDALKKGNQSLVDSIYPLIGRAVRRSVRESLSALSQSVDATMRDALTLKQLRWRIEARRQGIPLSQLVLQKSLLFRVEEAFLIHQETGLLVAHAGARGDDNRDLISGMFTAIQDFVADSFGGHAKSTEDDGLGDRLGRFQVGAQDVWLFHGPSAYLAIVIEGDAPARYREEFHAVLEEVHERFGAELGVYQGDGEALKPTELLLEDCLVEQQREQQKGSPKLFWILVAVILALLLAWFIKNWQTQRLHEEVRAHLEDQPGVVITEESRDWLSSRFEIMADPSISDVEVGVREAFPQKPVSLKVAPYRSLDPALELTRIQQFVTELAPSPKEPVLIKKTETGFMLEGGVPEAWLQAARRRLPEFPNLDISLLINTDWINCETQSLEIAGITIQFLPNQAKVAPGEAEKWQGLAEAMQDLRSQADQAGLPCSFGLFIGPSSSKTAALQALDQERLQVCMEALTSRGLESASLRPQHQWTEINPNALNPPGPESFVVLPSFLLSRSPEEG